MSKSYKNIDDLFRDKFENFEVAPPEHVWAGIQSAIDTGGGSSGGGLSKGGIVGFTVLFVTIGILTAYLFNSEFSYNIASAESINLSEYQLADVLETDFPGQIADTNPLHEQFFNGEPAQNTVIEAAVLPISDAKRKKNTNREKKKRRKTDKKSKVPVWNNNFENKVTKEKYSDNSLNAGKQTLNQNLRNQENLLFLNSLDNGLITNKVLDNNVLINSRDYHLSNKQLMQGLFKRSNHDFYKKGSWAAGVYFMPKSVYYPSDNNLLNNGYEIDLTVTRKSGNLFLETGIGYSRVNDKGSSRIEYNRFLGTYEDVYDVTFDTVNNEIIPTFHTETVNVYDTIDRIFIEPTKRKFTYLQVPLMIGTGKEYRRMGWFVKTGAIVAVLINENIPVNSMMEGNSRILDFESDLPSRVSTNWQLVFSVGATMRMSNRISLSIEPMVRYYIKPAYELNKITTNHPYAIGLRSGLVIEF